MSLDTVRVAAWLVSGWVLAGAHAAVALQPADVLAFEVGPLILRPRFDLSERFDSNIFYTERDQTTDLITVLSPGLRITMGTEEGNNLLLNYTLEDQIYATHSELNTLNHLLTFAAFYGTGRLTIRGSDSVEILGGVLGGRLNLFNTIPVERTVQAHQYQVSYGLSEKSSFYLEGLYNITDYETGVFLHDYERWQVTPGFDYKALRKVAFFGEVYYGQMTITPNHPLQGTGRDLVIYGGYLGVRGEFTPKISGRAKIGDEERSYGVGGSLHSLVMQADLAYVVNPKLSFKLIYVRQSGVAEESAQQSYISDSVSLTMFKGFGQDNRWLTTLNLHYLTHEYDVANLVDSLYKLTAGLAYRIKPWMSVGLNYEFEKFLTERQELQPYDAHRLALKLAIGY